MSDSEDNLKRIELKKPPEGFKELMIALKWIEFLVGKVGHSGLEEVLEFYKEMGWINDDVLVSLEKLSMGFRSFRGDGDQEFIREEEADLKPQSYLTSKDHIKSLLYIRSLKGEEIDNDLIAKLNKKFKRINKRASNISDL
ncbi:hypothetical protein C9439_00355 [archaeon SCG-AAA382B04]|nr:hypothetical protein C9439_00355 [archaeon SCG-AAA382B04]